MMGISHRSPMEPLDAQDTAAKLLVSPGYADPVLTWKLSNPCGCSLM